MPVTMVGLVSYADDGKVFRKVYPTRHDNELDDARWVTEGCAIGRTAVMRKVRASEQEALLPMTGTP